MLVWSSFFSGSRRRRVAGRKRDVARLVAGSQPCSTRLQPRETARRHPCLRASRRYDQYAFLLILRQQPDMLLQLDMLLPARSLLPAETIQVRFRLTKPLLGLRSSILNDLNNTSLQCLDRGNVVGENTHVTSSSWDIDLGDTLGRVKGLNISLDIHHQQCARADLVGKG